MCHLLYKINQKVPNKSIVLDVVGVHPDPSEPKMMACYIWKRPLLHNISAHSYILPSELSIFPNTISPKRKPFHLDWVAKFPRPNRDLTESFCT